MKAFIALFRGINVGGANKLYMKDLCALMANLGLKNVTSYIQSGNVVFHATDEKIVNLAGKIGDSIEQSHGFRPEVTVLDKAAIDHAISGNPFCEADAEPGTVYLTFLSAPPVNPDFETLERIRAPSERFALKGQVFFLHAPEGVGRSRLAARAEKCLGVSGTSRNWRTVLKLKEMIHARI